MMMIMVLVTLLLFPTTTNSSCTAPQWGTAPPKHEDLTYTLSWEGILRVGTGTISMRRHEGRYELEMTARSARFFDFFFKVRDHFTSRVLPGFRSFEFYEKKIREGHYRRHDQVWYDPKTREIRYLKNGKPRPSHKASPPLFDPLSVLHAYRFLCPKDGNCSLVATDGKHVDKIKVILLGKESIRVGGQAYEAIKVMPVWRRMQGVFRKKKGGHVYVWFEARPPYTPLQLEAAIFIGKVVARLTDHEVTR